MGKKSRKKRECIIKCEEYKPSRPIDIGHLLDTWGRLVIEYKVRQTGKTNSLIEIMKKTAELQERVEVYGVKTTRLPQLFWEKSDKLEELQDDIYKFIISEYYGKSTKVIQSALRYNQDLRYERYANPLTKDSLTKIKNNYPILKDAAMMELSKAYSGNPWGMVFGSAPLGGSMFGSVVHNWMNDCVVPVYQNRLSARHTTNYPEIKNI